MIKKIFCILSMFFCLTTQLLGIEKGESVYIKSESGIVSAIVLEFISDSEIKIQYEHSPEASIVSLDKVKTQEQFTQQNEEELKESQAILKKCENEAEKQLTKLNALVKLNELPKILNEFIDPSCTPEILNEITYLTKFTAAYFSSMMSKENISQTEKLNNETCKICKVEFESNDNTVRLGCNHRFHIDCVQNGISTYLDEKNPEPLTLCPQSTFLESDNCLYKLDPSELASIVSDPMQALRIQEFLLRAMTVFKLCPKCGKGVANEAKGFIRRCQVCDQESCFSCGRDAHIGTSCAELDEMEKTEHETIREIFDAGVEANFGFCPNPDCKLLMERKEGCNDMICGQNHKDHSKIKYKGAFAQGCGKAFDWRHRIQLVYVQIFGELKKRVTPEELETLLNFLIADDARALIQFLKTQHIDVNAILIPTVYRERHLIELRRDEKHSLTGSTGSSLLTIAIRIEVFNCVEALLEYGANPKIQMERWDDRFPSKQREPMRSTDSKRCKKLLKEHIEFLSKQLLSDSNTSISNSPSTSNTEQISEEDEEEEKSTEWTFELQEGHPFYVPEFAAWGPQIWVVDPRGQEPSFIMSSPVPEEMNQMSAAGWESKSWFWSEREHHTGFCEEYKGQAPSKEQMEAFSRARGRGTEAGYNPLSYMQDGLFWTRSVDPNKSKDAYYMNAYSGYIGRFNRKERMKVVCVKKVDESFEFSFLDRQKDGPNTTKTEKPMSKLEGKEEDTTDKVEDSEFSSSDDDSDVRNATSPLIQIQKGDALPHFEFQS